MGQPEVHPCCVPCLRPRRHPAVAAALVRPLPAPRIGLGGGDGGDVAAAVGSRFSRIYFSLSLRFPTLIKLYYMNLELTHETETLKTVLAKKKRFFIFKKK